jgi:flagellar hook assembly protein FlgD
MLGRSFPNPLPKGRAATIPFTLSYPQEVSVTILDIQGRIIRRLVNGGLEMGAQAAFWDGQDDHGGEVPSGIYLYRLKTRAIESTREIVKLQ